VPDQRRRRPGQHQRFHNRADEGFLRRFTETFARTHIDPGMVRPVVVERVRFNYETESWERGRFDLPFFNGDFVLLTPNDLLTKDRIWINRDDLLNSLDQIAEALPNDVLRAQIDNYFVKQLSHPEKPTKKEMRAATIEQFPELIEHYIREKEDHGDDAEVISAERVRAAHMLYVEEVKALRGLLSRETVRVAGARQRSEVDHVVPRQQTGQRERVRVHGGF
jgi:hypothetical protein